MHKAKNTIPITSPFPNNFIYVHNTRIRRELPQILPTYSSEYSFHLNNSIREILEMRGLSQDSIRVANQRKSRRCLLVKRNVEEVHGLPENFLHPIVKCYKIVDWNQQPWFRGAFAVDLPGQKINFAHTILEPEYNNRVFFAGEHTAVKHGWMQGVLYSGMLAANTLVMNLR